MSRPAAPVGADPAGPPPDPARFRLLAAHAEAARFYRRCLAASPRAQRYLSHRGLPSAAGEERWGLGFAPPSWGALVGHLRDHGYRDEEIVSAGLALRGRRDRLLDRFRDRVMFPLRDGGGAVVGFTGRDLSGSPGTPKYLNSPSTPIFRKAEVLYGLAEQHWQLADRGTRRVIVEGPFDVLAVAAAHSGHGMSAAAAVAPCGTALTDGHVALLGAGDGSGVPLVVAFDPDRAGRAAADRAHRVLACWPGGVSALELAADPAELLRSRGVTATRAALAAVGRPLLDAVIDHRLQQRGEQTDTGWIEARVAALRSVAPLIASDPRPCEPGRRVAALAVRLDLRPATVTTAVLEAFDAAGHVPAATPGRRDHRGDGRSGTGNRTGDDGGGDGR